MRRECILDGNNWIRDVAFGLLTIQVNGIQHGPLSMQQVLWVGGCVKGSRREEYSKNWYTFRLLVVIKAPFQASSISLIIYFYDWNYIKKL